MIELRPSDARGSVDFGWLKSFHSFSFGQYYDPNYVEYGALRVINEDCVAPGTGFGAHPHKDMEIVSYVLEGELAHEDSLGNGSVIRPGEVQRMSAGTGITHSEKNPSDTNPVHFLQIWFKPNKLGIQPGYEQKYFGPIEKRGKLRLVASSDGAQGSVSVQQDVRMYAGLFDGDEQAQLAVDSATRIYVHVARGGVTVNAKPLSAGDALKISGVDSIDLRNGRDAEVLIFDLS